MCVDSPKVSFYLAMSVFLQMVKLKIPKRRLFYITNKATQSEYFISPILVCFAFCSSRWFL